MAVGIRESATSIRVMSVKMEFRRPKLKILKKYIYEHKLVSVAIQLRKNFSVALLFI